MTLEYFEDAVMLELLWCKQSSDDCEGERAVSGITGLYHYIM